MRKALKEAITGAVQAARDIAAAAETENRDLTGDEREKVEKHLGEARELKSRGDLEDELRVQMNDLTGDLGADDLPQVPEQRGGEKSRKALPGQRRVAKSLGREFIESAEYKALLASAPGGRFGEKQRVQSSPFETKQLLTGGSATSAGALVEPDDLGLIVPYEWAPRTMRDLVAPGSTSSDLVTYVRQVNAVNSAAPVPEATTNAPVDGTIVTPAMGGVKPQSGFEFETDQTPVKTIAHWMAATKRALSDAGQIRTLIDQFLREGLEEELDQQILLGNGIGENFTGIANTSGIQVLTGAGAPNTDLGRMTATRTARRMVQIGGRATPTAYVMSPLEWERIELTRDGDGRFYGNGPFAMTPPRLWGLPVVECELLPAGQIYVADWRQSVLWDREQATVQVTDSHADFFVRNLVAVLAELRAAFTVIRPAAFVRITFV